MTRIGGLATAAAAPSRSIVRHLPLATVCIVLNLDVDVVRIVVARFADPAIGPAVVVHVPLLAERAVEDVHRVGVPGFAGAGGGWYNQARGEREKEPAIRWRL